ncbi:MAG TPA: hypothetical protein VG897_03385 [Terriglobales bacterium]|nr:hypothetical protein [Terriglobales bacterium]
MLGFVITSYLKYDVVEIRGVVLSLVLIGLVLVVQSEARTYVPVHRNRH